MFPMKIKIRQLDWNPFRNIKEYPINKEKVNGLVKSIKQTSFWDNILARESPINPKHYEIAYGHHRLVALHKVYGKDSRHEVDIPVRDLDDATMLKIMANENAAAWTMDTAVVMETIKATEKFLSGEKKYGQGPTAIKIVEFLGGVFSLKMVEEALALIHATDAKEVDTKAVKTIDQPSKASEFARAIKNLSEDKKPTPEKQLEIAEKIVEKEIPKRGIKQFVEWEMGVYGDVKPIKPLPDISQFAWEHRAEIERLTKKIDALADERESIPNTLEWKSFRAACALLLTALNRLFGNEEAVAMKGEKSHGKKKERRAVEQRQARALLTE